MLSQGHALHWLGLHTYDTLGSSYVFALFPCDTAAFNARVAPQLPPHWSDYISSIPVRGESLFVFNILISFVDDLHVGSRSSFDDLALLSRSF